MRVWLLTVGEPLPIDPGAPRLLRCGLLANLLADQGHEVVWWTANFRHTQKDMRFCNSTAIEVGRNFKIWCLHSRPYGRNISAARILANRDVAAEFNRLAPTEAIPDIVVSSYPIGELARAGAEYAQMRKIPAVIDIRDFWPDIWPTVLPKPLHPLGSLAIWPLRRRVRTTMRMHTSICGITDNAVEWGLEYAGRARSASDRAFPLAYQKSTYDFKELAKARAFWADKLGEHSAPKLRLCFFGILRRRLGIDLMLEAVRRLPASRRQEVQLVVCGEGESLQVLRSKASTIPQILMPGWVNGPQIEILASVSHAGILPYTNDTEFVHLLPNKVIEYLAYGLPVLSGLDGPVSALISGAGCGLRYRDTDPSDLARVISSLLDNPGDLTRLSVNAKTVFEKRFMAQQVYGRYVDLLMHLVKDRQQREPARALS